VKKDHIGSLRARATVSVNVRASVLPHPAWVFALGEVFDVEFSEGQFGWRESEMRPRKARALAQGEFERRFGMGLC